jgi:GTP-binding protein EngB required for normal cell division
VADKSFSLSRERWGAVVRKFRRNKCNNIDFYFYSGSTTRIVTLTDPNLVREVERYREENAKLMTRFNELSEQIEKQRVNSFEDLQRVNQHAAEILVKLAANAPPYRLGGLVFGFFGLTSTGKSTMINKLIGFDIAETGAGETTKEIRPYDGQRFRLFDIPGRNDDISYFSMEYIAFWKGLTGRLVLITTTIKEMIKVFRLLDAIHLRYDIVINKFDLVPVEERQKFKQKINQQIRECELRGVDHVWYVSALNPNQFPHWLLMINSLTYHPENVFDDYEPFDHVVHE